MVAGKLRKCTDISWRPLYLSVAKGAVIATLSNRQTSTSYSGVEGHLECAHEDEDGQATCRVPILLPSL